MGILPVRLSAPTAGRTVPPVPSAPSMDLMCPCLAAKSKDLELQTRSLKEQGHLLHEAPFPNTSNVKNNARTAPSLGSAHYTII